jgi:hypothetical protein
MPPCVAVFNDPAVLSVLPTDAVLPSELIGHDPIDGADRSGADHGHAHALSATATAGLKIARLPTTGMIDGKRTAPLAKPPNCRMTNPERPGDISQRFPQLRTAGDAIAKVLNPG